MKNVNKLRKLGKVVSGNGTVDYEIELAGRDGLVEVYNYSLVGTYDKQALEDVGEGYFVLNDVEERQFGGARTSSIKNYYKGSGGFDYSMEYEKPLNSLEFFYEMVYGRAGEMFLKPPYSKYLEAEGGEQYDYYTIERDYDEGYMNAREPTLKTNRLFDPLYYTQYMMMNDMSDRISTAFHPNAEVREQSGYGTREKQRDAIFNGLKSWNEQMIEDLNGVKRSIDMELGDRKFEAEGDYTQPRSRAINNILWELRDLDAEQMFYTILTYLPTKQANQLLNQLAKGLAEGEIPNRNLRLGAEESINPKDYIQVWILDEQGNGMSPTYLNTYDLRFGEKGSTYFKALREALDEGVKRGDYEGYKIRKVIPSPATHDWADWLSYDRAYNDSYSYNVYIYGKKFLMGDVDIPIVENNKYTIDEGNKSYHVVSEIFEKPQKKTTEPMDGLGSLFGAEDDVKEYHMVLNYGSMKPMKKVLEWYSDEFSMDEIIEEFRELALNPDLDKDYNQLQDVFLIDADDDEVKYAYSYVFNQFYKDGVDEVNAESFEAKGIDTFTEPFNELRTGSILNKAILLGSLGVGAMIGLKLRK